MFDFEEEKIEKRSVEQKPSITDLFNMELVNLKREDSSPAVNYIEKLEIPKYSKKKSLVNCIVN